MEYILLSMLYLLVALLGGVAITSAILFVRVCRIPALQRELIKATKDSERRGK